MIVCMASGTLSRSPETRQSKAGNSYCLASIRIPGADGDSYVSILAFSDLAPVLAGLAKGDPVTVIGTVRVSTYVGKDGTTKSGLSVTVSRIVTIADHQAPPGKRRLKGDGPDRRHAAAGAQPDEREYAADEFADEIPF